jgi:tetratricopeptide (TPR) repeat protein
MRRRISRIVLLTLLSAGAGLLPFALLEGVLRIAGYGYPSAFFVPVSGAPFYTTNQRFGLRFFPPRLARTPAPERFAASKPERAYRIFVLGESAAMGFPEPGFSFGRHLEMMLRRMYPAARFEVIQASMTAINSHAVLPIAQDAARLAPDLFIVYCGNNEVVGPYGAGTVFTRTTSTLPLIRAAIRLGATRTGQLFSGLLPRRDQPAEWRGMEMFLRHTVQANDPRLESVYANFRQNLGDVCRVARRSGARVILSTVAVNLKDSPPFAGEAAAKRYALGDFVAARDLDALRFRADSRTNRTIREVAAAEKAGLLDAEAIFARDGVPGDNLFYEHVHLKPAGSDLLARSLAPQVAAALDGLDPTTPVPDAQTVANDLVRTTWDDYRARADIAAMMARPPFSRRITDVSPPDVAAMDDARARYAAALATYPDDLHIRQRFADLLAVRNESSAAEREWRDLLSRLPDVDAWRLALGSVLLTEGKVDEALAEYRVVLRSPQSAPAAQFGIGTVLQRKGMRAEAAEAYRAALQMNPDYAEAENNLGLLRMEAGDQDGALTHYRRSLTLKPDLTDARLNLADALRRRAGTLAAVGTLPLARTALEEAVRLTPAAASLQYDLGTILSREGRLKEAAERFTEAVRLQPTYAEAWNNLGAALARQGQMKQAADCFRKALAVRPDYPAARANLAAATGTKQ